MQQLEHRIRTFIRQQQLFAKDDHLLVACSGGVDSVVLLHFLAARRTEMKITISAAYVDHMLRGDESAKDGILVEELCAHLDIPFHSIKIPIGDILERHGGNVQAVCRRERYAFFEQVMNEQRCTKLAVAHHADDQLESVLIDLIKGAIPMGMPVQRPFRDGAIVRPLLAVNKEDLYNYANDYNLVFNEDPSNQSDAYLRNRLRNYVLPRLVNENEQIQENVVRMTTQLQEDEQALQELAAERVEELIQYSKEGFLTMKNTEFIAMPTALQRRVVKLLLNYLYAKEASFVPYSSTLIERILEHLNSQQGNVAIDLPLSYQFRREYDKLTLVKEGQEVMVLQETMLPKDTKIEWNLNLRMYWTTITSITEEQLKNAGEVMYFSLPEQAFPLRVRYRQEGDRIQLPGMAQKKKVSRLFIDEKVDKVKREELPIIITNDGTICAIPTLRYGEHFTKKEVLTSKYVFIVEK